MNNNIIPSIGKSHYTWEFSSTLPTPHSTTSWTTCVINPNMRLLLKVLKFQWYWRSQESAWAINSDKSNLIPPMKKGRGKLIQTMLCTHLSLWETTSYKNLLQDWFFWETNKISRFILLLKNLSKHDSAAATSHKSKVELTWKVGIYKEELVSTYTNKTSLLTFSIIGHQTCNWKWKLYKNQI
jgi:hypothetical protein